MPQDIIKEIRDILDIHTAFMDPKSGLYTVMSPFPKSGGEVAWRPMPYMDQKAGKKHYEYTVRLDSLEEIPKDIITLVKEIRELQDHIKRLLKKETELKIQLKQAIDKLVDKDSIHED